MDREAALSGANAADLVLVAEVERMLRIKPAEVGDKALSRLLDRDAQAMCNFIARTTIPNPSTRVRRRRAEARIRVEAFRR